MSSEDKRCLPCFNTYCESCLKNYLCNSQERENATKEGIPCPVCKDKVFAPKHSMPVDEWASQFPTNHLVDTLIDIVPVSSEIEFCEPCKDGQQSKIAMFWCQQCAEALCDECSKCHKAMKATKTHNIMATEEVRSNPRKTMTEDLPCYEHNKKNYEMFCEDHEQPCCVVCVATNHRKCEKIFPISQVAFQRNVGLDSDKLTHDMSQLCQEADLIKHDRMEVLRTTKGQRQKILKEIAEVKMKLIKHIEKLENQILGRFNATHTTDLAVIQEQVDYCNSVSSAMDNGKATITTAKEQKLPKKEFVALHLGKKKMEECIEGLRTIYVNSSRVSYIFDEDIHVTYMTNLLKVLGKLDVTHVYPNRPKPPPEPSFIQEEVLEGPQPSDRKSVTKVKQFNVKVRGDRKDCKITSLKFWSDKKVFLVDLSNSKLKLFGEFGDLLCFLSLTSVPWDCAFIDKTRVAVTFPNERKIHLYTVRDAIASVGHIRTQRGCHGICFAEDTFITTYASSCIRVLAMDGTVRMMIDTDLIGKKLFSKPEFVTYNVFSSRLFISDYNNHSVTALKYTNGQVDKAPLYIYPVSGPKGISMDPQGHMYVCGFWSSDVHLVGEKGALVQILMDTLSRPLSIGFNAIGDRFALSEEGSPNQVKLFRVEADKDELEYSGGRRKP